MDRLTRAATAIKATTFLYDCEQLHFLGGEASFTERSDKLRRLSRASSSIRSARV
jgi:hypothetical protein